MSSVYQVASKLRTFHSYWWGLVWSHAWRVVNNPSYLGSTIFMSPSPPHTTGLASPTGCESQSSIPHISEAQSQPTPHLTLRHLWGEQALIANHKAVIRFKCMPVANEWLAPREITTVHICLHICTAALPHEKQTNLGTARYCIQRCDHVLVQFEHPTDSECTLMHIYTH